MPRATPRCRTAWSNAIEFRIRIHLGNVACEGIRAAKFLIAGEPAEYRGSGRHRGIGTNGPELSLLASRSQIVSAISELQSDD
jgi:hypothetical protein